MCDLYNLYLEVNLSKINKLEGEEASNFVSEINKISILLQELLVTSQIYFLDSLLRYPQILGFGFLSLILFNVLKFLGRLSLSELRVFS